MSWKHNGEDIKFIERANIEHTQKNGDASLIISDVKEEDLGSYKCTGRNEKGTDGTVIQLSLHKDTDFQVHHLCQLLSSYY